MNERHFTDDALDDQLRRFYQDVYEPVEPAGDMWRKLAAQLDEAQPPSKVAITTIPPSARASMIPKTSARIAGSTRQWLGSAIAVMLTGIIIIASVVLFHTFRGHGSSPANKSTGQSVVACPPASTQVTLPHNASIGDLALTSPTSGWAVGAINSAQGDTAEQSLILQFKDCHWSPAGPSLPGVGLSSISMTTPDDGWIIGSNDDETSSVLLHLVAGEWQSVTIPLTQAATALYSSVRMLSSTEGWILAFLHKSYYGQINEILFHLHAGAWSAVTMPFTGADDVMPVAPDDAWVAVGTTSLGQTSQLYHYQQGKWTSARVPAGMTIYRLHLNGPDDAWATGAVPPPAGTPYGLSPALLHYDGTTWSPVALKNLRNPSQDLEMLSADDGWAVGTTNKFVVSALSPTVTLVQRYVSGAWQSVALPDAALSAIDPIVCATADDCWAIGATPVVVPLATTQYGGTSSFTYETTPLLHYVAGRWTVYSPG